MNGLRFFFTADLNGQEHVGGIILPLPPDLDPKRAFETVGSMLFEGAERSIQTQIPQLKNVLVYAVETVPVPFAPAIAANAEKFMRCDIFDQLVADHNKELKK